jgi:hypothetical protein
VERLAIVFKRAAEPKQRQRAWQRRNQRRAHYRQEEKDNPPTHELEVKTDSSLLASFSILKSQI